MNRLRTVWKRPTRKILQLGIVAVAVASITATPVLAATITWFAVDPVVTTTNRVATYQNGIFLLTVAPVNVKTTFRSKDAGFVAGWHYHRGPNFVSVTSGTLKFWRNDCTTFEVHANQGYIEAAGEVLMAQTIATPTEWFTTRVYPADGLSDQVDVTHAACP